MSTKFTVWVVATTMLLWLCSLSSRPCKCCQVLCGVKRGNRAPRLLIHVASRVSRARQGWGRRALPQMDWGLASFVNCS